MAWRAVLDRPVANRRIYAVRPDGLAELRRFLEDFWADALHRFAAFAEDADTEPPA